MRIVILGGTGLTGPHVVRGLADLGHDLTIFHRAGPQAPLPEGVRQIQGDFAHPPRSLRHPTPDVVIHMFAMTEADATEFLAVFRGFAGRAIVISSGDVYASYGRLKRLETGPSDPAPLTENAPLRESRYPDGGLYDKVLVEHALRAQSELPVTILRFPAVYGPHDQHHRLGQWLRKFQNDTAELRIADDFSQWRWTHGYSEDVAHAVVLSAIHDHAAGRTWHVGESQTPTWADRLTAWSAAAGWTGRIVPVPPTALPADQRLPFDFAHPLSFDTSRIRQELGYREGVAAHDAIARTIAWERGL